MKQQHTPAWKRVLYSVLLAIFVIVGAFVAGANYVYYHPLPANLPCRNCSGEAQAIQVNGFDLYTKTIGSPTSRAPVVVVHGGPGHSSLSFKQGLDFLARDRQVVFYDQRGSGNSQIKPDPSLYTVEQLVDELESFRRDVLGADKFVLVAHSAGGAMAQRYALTYPERLESMVLVSPSTINNGVSAGPVWNIVGPVFFVIGAGIPPAAPEQADAWFAEMLLKTSLPRLYDPNNRGLIENSGYVSYATWREVSRSMQGPGYEDALRKITVPTMVIYGAADAGYTGEANSGALCNLLPDCRLVGFERSGHWAFLEEPDRFAEEVTAFLNRQ